MSRKRNLTVDQVKELIQNNRNIVNIADILIELKLSKQTFYYYFPYDSDGLNEIKDEIGLCKVVENTPSVNEVLCTTTLNRR